MGALAPLCEAGVVCVVCPRAALAKTAKTKAVPIRMIGLLLGVFLAPPGGGGRNACGRLSESERLTS